MRATGPRAADAHCGGSALVTGRANTGQLELRELDMRSAPRRWAERAAGARGHRDRQPREGATAGVHLGRRLEAVSRAANSWAPAASSWQLAHWRDTIAPPPGTGEAQGAQVGRRP